MASASEGKAKRISIEGALTDRSFHRHPLPQPTIRFVSNGRGRRKPVDGDRAGRGRRLAIVRRSPAQKAKFHLDLVKSKVLRASYEEVCQTRLAQGLAAHKGEDAFNESACRSLVLNSSYQPVKLVSWQKALILWFQGKVEVLEYHEHAVKSVREEFPLPSVMRLKKFVSPRARTRLKFSRENIYIRDDFTCQYCGERFRGPELTLDHVVPASKNGRKDWTNVVAACRDCNHRKANRTPLAAGMPLLKEPRVPAWLPTTRAEFRLLERMPEAWEPYLQASPRAAAGG